MKYLYIKNILINSVFVSFLFISCQQRQSTSNLDKKEKTKDSIADLKNKEAEIAKVKPKTAKDIEITKELQYTKYTLEDTYPYKDTVRQFQWDKIKEKLAFIENFQDGRYFIKYGSIRC